MGNCAGAKKNVRRGQKIEGHEEKAERELTGEEYKLAGNKHFMEKKYAEAILEYSRAIAKNSSISIYYSNRAMCYYKIKDFCKAFEDGSCAYTLDSNNLKGLLMCIRSKASLALHGNLHNFEESLAYCKHFKSFSTKDHSQSTLEYCRTLKKKIKMLFTSIQRKHNKIQALTYYSTALPADIYKKLHEKLEIKAEKIESLNCPLTMEFFKEPGIISSGNTYEMEMVNSLIKSGNCIDPLSRSHFAQDRVYINLAVRDAVRWYSIKYPDIVFMEDHREIDI